MASCLVRAQDVSKAYRWVHLSHSHVHTHTHTHTHTNACMHSHKKHTHTHTHTHTHIASDGLVEKRRWKWQISLQWRRGEFPVLTLKKSEKEWEKKRGLRGVPHRERKRVPGDWSDYYHYVKFAWNLNMMWQYVVSQGPPGPKGMLGEKGVPGIAGPRVRVLLVIFISPVKTTCFCVHFYTFVTEVRYTTCFCVHYLYYWSKVYHLFLCSFLCSFLYFCYWSKVYHLFLCSFPYLYYWSKVYNQFLCSFLYLCYSSKVYNQFLCSFLYLCYWSKVYNRFLRSFLELYYWSKVYKNLELYYWSVKVLWMNVFC